MGFLHKFIANIGIKSLLVLFGVVIGAWLFRGCGIKPIEKIITRQNVPTIEYVETFIQGQTKIDTIYMEPQVIYRNNPIPVSTSTLILDTSSYIVNKYKENINNELLDGELLMTTKGTLEYWQFNYVAKQISTTRVDTLRSETTILQPKRGLLFVGTGVDINSEANFQSIHVGAGFKLKSDKLITYNYNFGTENIPTYHSVSFYFPIKPREWFEKRKN